MRRSILSLWCWMLLTLGLLCGCIPVDNIEPAFSSGEMDPEIAGAWKNVDSPDVPLESSFLAFRPRKTAYEMESRYAGTPEIIDVSEFASPFARTIKVDNVKFLIIDAKPTLREIAAKHPPDTATTENLQLMQMGGIWRYEVSTQTLSLFALKDQALADAIESGELTGTPSGSTKPPSLSKLDDATLRALARMANDPDVWKESRHVKIDDLDAAVDKARQYPATESTELAREVYVNAPAFNALYDSPGDLLRRTLQASPEWFVYQEGQTDIVADRREKINSVWQDEAGGYISTGQQQTRQRFRFTKRSILQNPLNFSHGTTRDIITNASATEGTVPLKLRRTSQGIESYLSVGAPGVWFEIFEQTPNEPRILTRDALSFLTQFTNNIHHNADTIAQTGYLSTAMPADAVSTGKPSIEVNEDQLTAFINPGEQGFVFLKVIDELTSSTIDDRNYDFGAKEYTGWSTDPTTLFLYQKDIRSLRWYVDENPAPVRIQLWFRKCNGEGGPVWYEKESSDDRLLLETRIRP